MTEDNLCTAICSEIHLTAYSGFIECGKRIPLPGLFVVSSEYWICLHVKKQIY